ncbi:MAG TPA: DUF2851 family protein [Ferruginibacter sp.]|nr:DUF2851 family protein [Ferruginibacter sp.]HPH92978.1 DUF2851 family protein [Ferruginibacter sp.]
MNERLLQYIWQFQYFNLSALATQQNENIVILHAGTLNKNQGPDFLDAKIKVGQTTWAGNVELHINSSGWNNHKHSEDDNYKNIILHVVWKDDVDLNLPFPVLELQHRVSSLLIEKYNSLMQSPSAIPCEKLINQADEFIWSSWQQRLLVERLIEKSQKAALHFAATNNHWEETFWRMLATNFGIKVNAEAFEKIAISLPVSILAKHKNQIHQLEALLLGQAGLMQGDFKEAYGKMLQKEYMFLKNKYKLQPINIALHYLRMRPSNFPSVRLAQLAMLIHQSSHLFSRIIAAASLKEIKKMLDVTANDHWHYHYMPDEASCYQEKKLGKQMTDNILINTVVPVLFAYGHYFKENKYKEKALAWLEEITAEKNNITKVFSDAGINIPSAFASQALIQLKNSYCNHKRCLECAVGNNIMKRE